MATSEAVFWEDDCCQIELLPVSNWQHCTEQIQAINQSSEKHWSEVGWKECYLRPENPQAMTSLGISSSIFNAALSRTLTQYEKVFIHSGSQREMCRRTLAWGDPHFTMFVDFDPNKIITCVWFQFRNWPAEKTAFYVSVLRSLPRADDLLLVDWPEGCLSRISDAKGIQEYFALHEIAG